MGVNPTNPLNIICASKKFINPQLYTFTISTSFSIDGGVHWTESPLALQPGWQGMTDPDLTFDAAGNAYLIAEADTFAAGGNVTAIGMFVFKSVDGGKTWQKPVQLHLDAADDKQWIDADVTPSSPFFGAVYAVWGAETNLRFARSTDHGATWKSVGAMPSGSDVFEEAVYAPSLCIGADGVIHISWHIPESGNTEISLHPAQPMAARRSPTPISAVTAMTTLTGTLPTEVGSNTGDEWPHLPNATFRVMTLLTNCVAAGNQVILAWADNREGLTRIYYRIGANGGLSWQGSASGQALLPGYPGSGMYHFHPQLSVAGDQAVGCALYEFGLKSGTYAIDVLTTFRAATEALRFASPATVTDKPWDPAKDAPWSHGDPNVTFIGEYFGFNAGSNWFATVWTDTRTGVQELFYAGVVLVGTVYVPPRIPSEVAQILEGVVQDGGGLVIVGGQIIHIPPPGSVDRCSLRLGGHQLVQPDSQRGRRPGAMVALKGQIIAAVAGAQGAAANPSRQTCSTVSSQSSCFLTYSAWAMFSTPSLVVDLGRQEAAGAGRCSPRSTANPDNNCSRSCP